MVEQMVGKVTKVTVCCKWQAESVCTNNLWQGSDDAGYKVTSLSA